jgi:hypothetical protein
LRSTTQFLIRKKSFRENIMRIVASLGEPIEIETDAGTLIISFRKKPLATPVRWTGRPMANRTVAAPTAAEDGSTVGTGRTAGGKRKRRMHSPEAKARLAEAARKRWAKAKKAGRTTL